MEFQTVGMGQIDEGCLVIPIPRKGFTLPTHLAFVNPPQPR